MSTMVLQEPRVLTDIEGNTFRLIPEDEYNYMIDIVELYEEDDLTEEDLRRIAISKEQAKMGMTSKSEDVFKRIREKLAEKWK
ncbi:toxin-antitoxin system, antitoxin component, PHD family protein [Capnocytophaga granulosa]|uniref:toxin-antitoxin system, antitoxin component, PHD family protein n=1 Tax=Capnocytophaga granulosa TaxID=45242 RepID=UPI00361ADA90